MKYEYIPGYMSELVMSQEGRRIESVKVVRSRNDKAQGIIRCDLLVHAWNQALFVGGGKTDAFAEATDLITNLLDERDPENGLVRDASILPNTKLQELAKSITEPWTASLKMMMC